ncbi:MAG TPA: glycoside hydrolase family 9 protein [Fibrobacteraceae bacterium]|nr:glycoside hydrolase family 9 protein [Fibrobacteraceae bacterium]
MERAPWQNLALALLKAFYFQRASLELEPQWAGIYARKAGHLDQEVLIHESAASSNRPAGSRISASKGWYDAGDYNKYVVNSGISVWTLLGIYEDFPDWSRTCSLDIPESGGTLPDVLAEAKWNLDWMLDMQDPADGGVYHKLTNQHFDPMRMPDQCQEPRFVVMKTTAASLYFAASLARAGRLWTEFDSFFAKRCLHQAECAFSWAQQNPHVLFQQPDEITTGLYADSLLEDKWSWAAIELWCSTGELRYGDIAQRARLNFYDVPSWSAVGTLGLATHALRQKESQASEKICALADLLLAQQQRNAFRVALLPENFIWGSNGVVANQGMVLLFAFQLTQEKRYLDGAVHQLDYLMGCNPLGMNFVTGQGSHSPRHPHHRISQADTIESPVPGFLVGGPNVDRQDAHRCPPYPNLAPACSYQDLAPAFACNEIAINWNAPAAYLAAGLQAIYSG